MIPELPEAPKGVTVWTTGGRMATIRWRRGHDGNARVRTYRLQYRVLPPLSPGAAHSDDWLNAPTKEVPAEHILDR